MAKLGVTNFAYGIGPYLRTTELLIAFNDELEKRGHERLSFIVPLVYGDGQKQVMNTRFREHIAKHSNEILLDAKLGALLKSVFYADSTYEDALQKWTATAKSVSASANEHLQGKIDVENLLGEKTIVDGKDIVVELNRSPRVRYDVAPSYSTTFGYIADILEKALKEGIEKIDVSRSLLMQGAAIADWVEGNQTMRAMAYPGTFSWRKDYKGRYPGEILVPPITDLPEPNNEEFEDGIFVTITGIPGLERLYAEAKELGLKLYSNPPKPIPGSEEKLPKVIPNKHIKLQFARSGWGSVWLSMFCGTPIVVPEFDAKDDPEIYFNNKAVEGLGIGVIYHSQSLKDILTEAPRVQECCEAVRKDIENRFGTLNGNLVCAKLFADHFLAQNSL